VLKQNQKNKGVRIVTVGIIEDKKMWQRSLDDNFTMHW